jgi:hypothetical protein
LPPILFDERIEGGELIILDLKEMRQRLYQIKKQADEVSK